MTKRRKNKRSKRSKANVNNPSLRKRIPRAAKKTTQNTTNTSASIFPHRSDPPSPNSNDNLLITNQDSPNDPTNLNAASAETERIEDPSTTKWDATTVSLILQCINEYNDNSLTMIPFIQ